MSLGTRRRNDHIAALFHESRRESAPAYRRLKDVLIEQIGTGRWPEGELLPSESQLVNVLGLSRMTINRALRELSAEGLVVRMAGVGTSSGSPPGRPRSRTRPSRAR